MNARVLSMVLIVIACIIAVAALGRPAAAPLEYPVPVAAEVPDDGKLRIIVFGAHPDDAEIRAGGVGAMWAAQGHHVKFVAVTNGDIGHWGMAGGPLAQRRKAEVERAAKILGIAEVQVLDIHDGELMPTLENRRKIVRLIRNWKADIVIAHRPNDYHPDHRYTGILVQDAAFMVTVPHFCPDTPYLTKNPVFLYGVDSFQKPNPFQADIIIGIDEVFDRKFEALMVMESQFMEGGCCNVVLPKTDRERSDRLAELRGRFEGFFGGVALGYREALSAQYGADRGGTIRFAEAFEVCEYGTQPTAEDLRRLFPFKGRLPSPGTP
jgi:N-acetylglucosamine malate deacetylase 1